ncbi:MAG: hypothetical protein PHY15_06030 [Eubacteriales bacterium]|nr:hypothetical protein [Eubacteriales bacterium]MDD4474794.1 hypothetical protein [Eubacteriales bacterium]
MKINGKRTASAIICLLLALSLLLVSCQTKDTTSTTSTDNTTSTTSTSGNSEPGWDEASQRYVSNLDPNKYKGENRKFKILVLGSSYGTYTSREFTFSEEDVLQSDVINDAAGRKNDYIKERYGVENVPIYAENNATNGISTLINTDIQTGTFAYDAVMPYMITLAGFAAEGKLIDMADTAFGANDVDITKIIDFSMPWWDQSSISELSIQDRVFFAAGDITLLNKVCTMAVTFNRDIITNGGYDSPYDLVRDGTWTIDKMMEMGRNNSRDNDGDGVMTYKDSWGLSSAHADSIGLYVSTGNHLATLDSNREPVIALDGAAQKATLQKILEVLNDRSWVIHAQETGLTGNEMWAMSLQIFGEDRALFRTSAFSAVEKLKSGFSVNYGIVPMPKINEEQDGYYSYVADNGTVSGIAITTGAEDVEFSAYMIEVNAVEGKNYLTPAYYDTVLKKQAAQDPDTVEMLDIIFSNTIYDVGRIYNFGNIAGIISQLVEAKSTDITSKIDENRSAIEEAMNTIVEKYNSL